MTQCHERVIFHTGQLNPAVRGPSDGGQLRARALVATAAEVIGVVFDNQKAMDGNKAAAAACVAACIGLSD